MIHRTAATILLFTTLLLACFACLPSVLPAAEEAENPTVVTTALDQLDLVVKMRPILPQITTGDPLRIAIHFEKKTGPVDHSDEALAAQMFDRMGTLASMDIAIKSPEGGWKLLKIDADKDAPPRQSSLVSDATLLLELGPDAVKSLRVGGQEEFTADWEWGEELQAGEYQIAVRGTLQLSTRERTIRRRGEPEEKLPASKTDIDFKTKPITIEVARADMRTQTLEELAEAAIDVVKERDEVKTENLEVIGIESIPIADADGNRVIRVRANIPKPKPRPGPDGGLIIGPVIAGGTGHWQYEVAMTPDGKPATVARWRKGFCVARGTTISTPDGDRAVEDLTGGQQVWSFDVESKQVVTANVLAILTSQTDETILINDQIRVTAEHPVFVTAGRKGTWKPAAQVQVGDQLLTREQKPVEVTSAKTVGGEIEVFDVAVDGPHNFFAGGLLVHNKSIAWTPKAFVPWYALWNRAPIKP